MDSSETQTNWFCKICWSSSSQKGVQKKRLPETLSGHNCHSGGKTCDALLDAIAQSVHPNPYLISEFLPLAVQQEVLSSVELPMTRSIGSPYTIEGSVDKSGGLTTFQLMAIGCGDDYRILNITFGSTIVYQQHEYMSSQKPQLVFRLDPAFFVREVLIRKGDHDTSIEWGDRQDISGVISQFRKLFDTIENTETYRELTKGSRQTNDIIRCMFKQQTTHFSHDGFDDEDEKVRKSLRKLLVHQNKVLSLLTKPTPTLGTLGMLINEFDIRPSCSMTMERYLKDLQLPRVDDAADLPIFPTQSVKALISLAPMHHDYLNDEQYKKAVKKFGTGDRDDAWWKPIQYLLLGPFVKLNCDGVVEWFGGC